MTQVSKKLLSRQLQQKVYETFWETVVRIKKSQEANFFFSDLFTKAERINFTKRLSIAVLLHKNYNWRQICDLLKVSPGTIAKVASKLQGEGFKLFFEKIESEKEWAEFWKELGKLYLVITHPEKTGRLGSEGVDQIYFKKNKKTLM